ncbi:Ig-like domain-containing protein [Bradyrhizobium japonicum]|uniref:Ig-like domain-containing protein n=1 Tax=Bradyrhizobium japonicum TaxID=375 RepID=UPI00040D909E|nr:Ig-like domain-containing protein [Bradyrhizobium japonicum]
MSIDPNNLAGTATLTFSDEFDSLSLWNGKSGTWDSTYWWGADNGIRIDGNQEVNWYINSNYAPTSSVTPWTVKDGILDLHAGAADPSIQPYINNAQYTSGMITSYHSFSQLYGYFEMSAQLPAGQGLWPAFWLLPTNNGLFGTVPAQELDIMEMIGNNPTIAYMTSHSSATGSMELQQGGIYLPSMSSGFHTYGMDWEPDTITWYVDGEKAFQIATPEDMHTPMYIIANLALYGPAITDPKSQVGGDMLINYIRAYSAKPPSVQISSFGPDSNVTGDGITKVKQVTLVGSAAVGATVQVFEGSSKLGTAIADSTGKWSFTTGNLSDGVHSFVAKTADQNGNIVSESSALAVTVDTTAPASPTMASFTPDSATVGDGITNQNQVTLNGSAEAGSTVQIFDGSTQIGTAIASRNGSWSFSTAALIDGSHAFTAKAMDVAGNVSSTSTSLTVKVDTAAPVKPVVVSFTPAQSTVAGTAEANATIALYDGATLIGSGKAKSDGTWSINVGSLSGDTHSFSATATDAAGNTGARSNVLEISKLIEGAGSTSLMQVGTSLHFVTGSTDVVFKLGGAAVTTDQFTNYKFIGAEKTASGYDVAWKAISTGLYTVAATDANGNFLSMLADSVSGTSDALRTLESTMSQDLNGDGTIGLPVKIIETAGTTALKQVGNSLHFVTGSTDVVFKLGGAAVTTDQFTNYKFIGAEKTASGYDVAWKAISTGLYTVAATDANGNFLSMLADSVSGTSDALRTLESTMSQDLNGDGTIGLPVKIIETAGTTALKQVGNSLHLVTGSTDVVFKLGGAAINTDQYPSYNFIGAEKTATGYDIAWEAGGTGLYTVAATDANGNFLSILADSVSGSSNTLRSLEMTMHQDLNGDGMMGLTGGLFAVDATAMSGNGLHYTIEAGGSLELAGAVSASITFQQTTGMLILDEATKFTGNIIGLSGNGDPTASDILDLRDIAYGVGTSVSYSGNTSSGLLTVTDTQNHTARLNLVGDYTHSTFNLASDGQGGTFVIDPPAQDATPHQTAAIAMVQGADGFVFRPITATDNTSTFDTPATLPSNEVLLEWQTNSIPQDAHLYLHAMGDTSFVHTHDAFMVHA